MFLKKRLSDKKHQGQLPNIEHLNLLSEYILLVLKHYTNRTAVRFRKEQDEFFISYETLYRDVISVVHYFQSNHIWESNVALIGDACYDWIVYYLAIICSGNVAVPIQDECLDMKENILRVDASYVLYNKRQYKQFTSIFQSVKSERNSIVICSYEEMNERVEQDSNTRVSNAALSLNTPTQQERTIHADTCAMMVFTSGTAGKSKIVMLSQQNIIHDIISITKLLASSFQIGERIVTILPVYHMFEISTGILAPLFYGATICITEGARYTLRDIKYYKPTVAVLVPMIVETFSKKIWSEARRQGKEHFLKRMIGISQGLRKVKIDVRNVLFKEICSQFGGELKLIVSGGAALNESCMEVMDQIGLTLYQGYGITECSPVVSCNTKEKQRKGSIGIIPEQQFYTAKVIDGEICIKGSTVMKGYYKDPVGTNEAMKDGWFHTGDLGYIDEDGYIFLTGRKKNLIILSDGNNVSPEELEEKIRRNELVQTVLVKTKEKGNQIIIAADIFIDKEVARLKQVEKPEEEVKTYIHQLNGKLPSYKKIKDIVFLMEDVEKNKMGKVKR